MFSESALESVELPSTLERIEYNAFCKCTNLANVCEAKADKRAHQSSKCSMSGSATFPESLRLIAHDAFAECESIKRITFPNKLESIGASCFSKCSFEEIVLPGSVKKVGAAAFENCEQLRSIQLNEGLKELGPRECIGNIEFEGEVFYGSGIESIKIPSTVKTIEPLSFVSCVNLRSVEFSEGLETIGAGAFAGSGIVDVILPSSTRTLYANAFEECTSLRNVRLNEGLETLGKEHKLYDEMEKGQVFANSSLEEIIIPSTLKVINVGAFERCYNLRKIEFPEGMESLGNDDVYSDDWSWLFQDSGLEEAVLPSTLKEMKSEIFEGAESLQTVWVKRGC